MSTLAGLYGLERALQGPAHDTWASVIDEVVAEAMATAPPGVYVEPKGLTVTLHFRKAPEHKGWVVDFAERQHAGPGPHGGAGAARARAATPARCGQGNRGRTPWWREHAARGEPLQAAAAFGDDVGDLPAFAALQRLHDSRRPAAHGRAGGRRRCREPARRRVGGGPDGGRRDRGGGVAA